jgi:dCMP deaminase
MKPKLIKAYMDTAKIFAELSHARRLHVGAIVVKDDRIISIGYNGMPRGWENDCEYEEEILMSELGKGTWIEKTGNLKTKPEVLHAERNALDKLARGNEGGLGATLFVTHSPCLECAKSIYGAGIKEVIYETDYKSDDGIKFLEACNIIVKKIGKDDK